MSPATAIASTVGAKGGKVICAIAGQGRFSRPEMCTISAASQRLSRLVSVSAIAFIGGTISTRMSSRRSGSLTPGDLQRRVRRKRRRESAAPAPARAAARPASAATSKPWRSIDDQRDRRRDDRRPHDDAADRVPFDARRGSGSAPEPAARAAPDSRSTRPGARWRPGRRTRPFRRSTSASPADATSDRDDAPQDASSRSPRS